MKKKYPFKICILRHGQADHNIGRFFNSNPEHKDYRVCNLTEQGRNEVAQSAAKIKELGFIPDTAYCSPLPRTLQTARIALDILGAGEVLLQKEVLLLEVQAGDFESKSFNEYPKDPWNPTDDLLAENACDVQKRAQNLLIKLEKEQAGKKILLITHGLPALLLTKILHGSDVVEKLPTAGFILF